MKFLILLLFVTLSSIQGLGIYTMIAVIPKYVLYPMLGLLAIQFLIVVLYMLSIEKDLENLQ